MFMFWLILASVASVAAVAYITLGALWILWRDRTPPNTDWE